MKKFIIKVTKKEAETLFRGLDENHPSLCPKKSKRFRSMVKDLRKRLAE